MADRKSSILRDPVHGDVRLTGEELLLLDTVEMQRMRGVRQLGTAYLVYPGAHHTRFEHMIGTAHLASRMIEAIARNRESAPAELLAIDAAGERLVRIAALLHDVTHIPFGHNIEDQTGLFERHDTPRRIETKLRGGELGERLAGLGVLDDVLGILDAGTRAATTPVAFKQIVSDTICSDILDYLRRDAYFTGLQLGYDPRLIESFKVDAATGNLFIDVSKRGLIREDVLSEIVRMLEARYYFSERVYYHHAKIAAGALIAKAVEYAIVSGAAREEDFHDQTDDSLIRFLEALEYDGDDLRQRARRLLANLRARRLPKRAAVYPRYGNEAMQDVLIDRFFAPGRHAERLAAERRVEAAVRSRLARDVDVLFYCPARRMQLKEARIHVRFPGESGVRPLSDFAARVPRLRDLESGYRNLWKFYVLVTDPDRAALHAVAAALEAELPGAVNVYAAP
jgi:HD superfamily phosphohydrolase